MSWTPHLDEKDARKIATHVVTELHALGGHIGRFSIFLEPEGFYFVADINGYTVQAQTGQGNFQYKTIAIEMMAAALAAQAGKSVAGLAVA